MSVCLRCDWRGHAAGDACPRCGVPLFRAEPPRRRPRTPSSAPEATAGDRRAVTPPPPDAEPRNPLDPGAADQALATGPASEPWPAPASASHRIAAWLTTAGLALAVVVLVATTPSSGPEARGEPSDDRTVVPPPALDGALVYSRRSPSADRLQLWVWDLGRGEVSPGPIVPKPFQLVAASTTEGAPRVGLTWRHDSGRLRAGVIDPYDQAASPRPIVSGDLIAWSPRGTRVSAATLGGAPRCPRRLSLQAVRIEQRAFDRSLRMRTCGEVLSLAGDGAVTYFTLHRNGRTHVAYGGIERPAIVLRNHSLLSVSWAGDMIVQATSGPSSGELAYFTRKTTERDPRPVPFNGDTSFAFGGVLAWAPNSFEALVVGTTAGRPSPTPGVYLLDTLPGDGIDPPRWLMDASGPTSATYTGDGVGIVLTGGDVFAYTDGVVTEVPLPLGAPLADGRVAWIP